MSYKNIKNIIINTACNLFKEKGYTNVSINDICSACSITKPTFYYHLKSKEDIICVRYENVVQTTFNDILNNSKTLNHWEHLMEAFNLIADISYNLGCDFMKILFIANLNESKNSFDLTESFIKQMTSLIEKAQKSGIINNKSDSLLLFNTSFYAFMGYELHWCFKNGMLEWKKQIRIIMENLFDVSDEYRLNPSLS